MSLEAGAGAPLARGRRWRGMPPGAEPAILSFSPALFRSIP